MSKLAWLVLLGALSGCGAPPASPRPTPPPAQNDALAVPQSTPCMILSGADLRTQEGAKMLDELGLRIRLSPEDEALRTPHSIDDVKKILRRDVLYLYPTAAAYAHELGTLEGRFAEATIELVMGESQLVASQVLSLQAAWVSSDLRIARATLATQQGEATTDRGRLLALLIRTVEDGNTIADALGAVGPTHVARGAEVVRGLRAEAPNDPRTYTLMAEYHRLRGEWTEFETQLRAAEATTERPTPPIRFLRGMEQLERYHRPEQGAQLMREALVAYPKFVRAQAALVLMAPNPRAALRELAKLKAMNPDHYLVMLLEPTLAADQELGRTQNATGMGGGDGPK